MLCAVATLGAGAAHATLVGDTVTVGHYTPDLVTPMPGAVSPPSTFVVTDGSADLYTFYWSYPFGYRVNVEAGSIQVDFSYIIGDGETATWSYPVITSCMPLVGCTESPGSFNGLAVSGLDDSSGNPLQGVQVATNMAGWNASRLSYGDDYVRFDWQGLSFTRDTYLNATLDFGQATPPAPVPEPGIYALLGLGLGLLGWTGRRRKRQAA